MEAGADERKRSGKTGCRNEGDERNQGEGKHLWNGCGSEAGKDEKERTEKPSKRNWKERMRNQPGKKRKDLSDERSEGAARKLLGSEGVKRAERKNRG